MPTTAPTFSEESRTWGVLTAPALYTDGYRGTKDMPSDLDRAYSLDNLRLAWQRVLSNQDAAYKGYFRHIYRAYSLSLDPNLKALHARLALHGHLPEYATKLYMPKASGILRIYSLLSLEDQIVYQALVNVVAQKLYPKVRKNYYKTVFGNIFTSPSNQFFYRSWKTSYRRFTNAVRNAYFKGHKYSASFDLTACYDSIDHTVLTYFLRDLGLDADFAHVLCDLLSHWTASSPQVPIYHGHGIPQGPQPSGLLAECVLRYFDDIVEGKKSVRYFRYVDDIRLFATSESELRDCLVRLDLRSKEIGLFPQNSKIHIHLVKDIDGEVKGISHPPEFPPSKPDPDQRQIRARLNQLTPRFIVTNETRFKYVLAKAAPNAGLSKRMLKVVAIQPHLYGPVFSYLSRATKLPNRVADLSLRLLRENDLYPSFTAALISALLGRLPAACEKDLTNYCSSRLAGPKVSRNAEVRAASASALLWSASLSWPDVESLFSKEEWWAKAYLMQFIRRDIVGDPSFEALLNLLIRDRSPDVATVAAERLVVDGLRVLQPHSGIQSAALSMLKAASLIGRARGGHCIVSEAMQAVLGPGLGIVNWKAVLGAHYKPVVRKIVPWLGYAKSDPSAWINMSDTINDLVLDALFKHDSSLGGYTLGNLGGNLNATSALASNYPKLFKAVETTHNLRLVSDLSHPVNRRTGRSTRRISYKEAEGLGAILHSGYLELWRKW